MSIDLNHSPSSHSTFTTDEANIKPPQCGERDYDALAGLAVEREIRGLKELCSDLVISLIIDKQFTLS